MAVDGLALGAIAAGALLTYGGLRDKSVLGEIRALIAGQPVTAAPAGAGAITAITAGATGTGPAGGGPAVAGAGGAGPRKAYLALRSAGFSRSAAIMMTAIGGVESGWSTTALNNDPATGDLSVGVWQINYYGSLGPERTALFGSWQDLLNAGVQTQADAAFTLYRQAGGFGPWQPDITSGKVLHYWSQATAAAAGGG